MSLVKNTTWICLSILFIATSFFWMWIFIVLAPVVITVGASAFGYYLYSFIDVAVVQPPELVVLELIQLTSEIAEPVNAVLVTVTPEVVKIVAG
ncbi:MAG: hypothetical protein LW875_02830 [Proteobacteria bacterium]|nr:hypothetical protein [Pseudomonadota bacterium]